MSFELKNIYAPLPATQRGKAVLLGGDPKNKENILYCCGNSVVIRSLKDPINCDLYNEHQHPTTVARYCPSGFYIASADQSGTVRIWDTTQKEHILKIELRVLAGAINDLAWSPDNQRIVAVGEGRDKFGAAFFWDTGASVGEISGHSKSINSVAFKQNRPFRVVTGGEDKSCNWFQGPPFKFQFSINDHERWINCVRFHPTGDLWVSVGQDKKGFFYDGKTAEKKHALSEENAHKGGIYACSFNESGSQLLTASGDKTAKIWDVETGSCVTTFNMGNRTEDQQLGCLWQGDYLVTMSLAGELSYLDPNSPDKPTQVLKGHNKFVTAMAYDKKSNTAYTGAYDSIVQRWNIDTSLCDPVSGGHSNQINRMEVHNDEILTAGMDDSVGFIASGANEFSSSKISTDSPVADVSGGNNLRAAVSMKSVYLIKGNAVSSSKEVSYTPKSVAVSPDDSQVLVGGDDNKIHVYDVSGDNLSENGTLEGHRGPVCVIKFSPDGKKFASAGHQREIFVWDAAGKTIEIRGWVFHTARPTDLAWSPNGVRLASVALDSNVIVWNTQEKSKRIIIRNAHHMGANSVDWIDDETVTSCGQDCAWKTHKV